MTKIMTRSDRVWSNYVSRISVKTKKVRIKYFNKIIDEIKTAKKSFDYFGFSSEEEKQIKAHLK